MCGMIAFLLGGYSEFTDIQETKETKAAGCPDYDIVNLSYDCGFCCGRRFISSIIVSVIGRRTLRGMVTA